MPSLSCLPAFNTACPHSFYLLKDPDEMEALSDAVLVAAGVSLPVHSQVLSLQSGVLRRMFADFQGESGPGAADRPKLADKDQQLVLHEPLKGCSAFEAALFLRFCYQPEDMTPACLEAARGSLPALLRLAHKLEVERMLASVAQHMTEASGATTEELVAWADAAEDCEQADLRLACISRLAQRLVENAPSENALAAGIADAAQLEGCSKCTLLLLLGLMAGANRQLVPFRRLLGTASVTPLNPSDVAAAVRLASNPASFEWRIDFISQQPSEAGHPVRSHWFVAGGREWQLSAYLNGRCGLLVGHISLFISAKQCDTRASVTLAVRDQDTEGPLHVTRTAELLVTTSGMGYPKFISHQQLHSRPGYLAGDTLVIRAEVRVLL